MSANDVLHLDANFQDWCAARAAGLTDVEPFLYYVTEQILKEFNFADEDVRYGITDHSNDGGVDAFYFIAGRNTLIKDNSPIEGGTERVWPAPGLVDTRLS
jgi:hypothetical protein